MHSNQSSSLGKWLWGSGIGSYTTNSGINYDRANNNGLFTGLLGGIGMLNDYTGGLLGNFQQAAYYPSKLLGEATIGNTEMGKDWLKFVDDNFMINNVQRGIMADANNIVNKDELESTLKRQRLDDSSGRQVAIPSSIHREVLSNKAYRERTGKIFQAPPGYNNIVRMGTSRVPQSVSSGSRLQQLHEAHARLQSY